MLGRDADTGVAHFDHDAAAALAATHQHTAGAGVANRVRYQIAQYQLHQGTMQAHPGSVLLGAGGTAQLTLADSKLVKFEVTQNSLTAGRRKAR